MGGIENIQGLENIHGLEDIHGLENIQGFTDIHCHVLPMVDDGAETMEMALDMLRIAAEEGIRKMILTPHQKADRKCVTPEGIIRRMVLLQEEADKKGIPVKLFPGNEIFYRHGLGELLELGKIRTLADSHYVLVEFLPGEDFGYIRDALNRLISFGYWPVVAHVERYMNVVKNLQKAEELKADTQGKQRTVGKRAARDAVHQIEEIVSFNAVLKRRSCQPGHRDIAADTEDQQQKQHHPYLTPDIFDFESID